MTSALDPLTIGAVDLIAAEIGYPTRANPFRGAGWGSRYPSHAALRRLEASCSEAERNVPDRRRPGTPICQIGQS